MHRLSLSFFLLFFTASGWAAALPGFRPQLVANVSGGFVSSLAVDSRGAIYYTTTNGGIWRLGGSGAATKITSVNTVQTGDSGLLGIALRGDHTAIVHYTTPNQVADVISSIDLDTGAETVIHAFDADIQMPSRGSPPEHHGGNPTIAPDGSIFVGIGDYGGGLISQLPDWNGGKIWGIRPDGSVQQFALGVRNPFDMAWDAANQRLILGDNGDINDDEIDIIRGGENLGWPFTAGNQPPIAGDTPPVYTFPDVIAPTGLLQLDGKNALLPRGYLLGAFVTKAIYFIGNIDAPQPIAVLKGDTPSVIDVAEGPDGQIYFATGSAIYKLITPAPGDCNGDGLIDANDYPALLAELADGPGERTTDAQNGAFAGSWGCDVNGDGLIDQNDVTALQLNLKLHVRVVRRR